VMLDWTFDLFFPRDINLLSPQYTRLLKEVHLETDDILFNPGEPAFSLYFVKEGVVDLLDGEHVVKTVRGGDYFGERALLEDKQWRYQAVARAPSNLVALGDAEFHAIVEGSSALKTLFTRSAKAYAATEEMRALKAQLSPLTLNAPAGTLMNTSVDALTIDTSLPKALALFRAQRHGSYPVLDDAQKLLGVVKRDDLYDFLKGQSDLNAATVRDLPLTPLPTCHEEANGHEIVELFLRSGRNKVLVTDPDQRLLGLVTLIDLVEHSLEVGVGRNYEI